METFLNYKNEMNTGVENSKEERKGVFFFLIKKLTQHSWENMTVVFKSKSSLV